MAYTAPIAEVLRAALQAQAAYDHIDSTDDELAAGLKAIGVTFSGRIYDKATDTHGWAGTEVDPGGTMANVIAIAGTRSWRNAETDADDKLVPFPYMAFQPMAHRGGLAAWSAVRGELTKFLIGPWPVRFRGHSLGGLEATMGAADLANQHAAVTSITFGSPMVGNKQFAGYYDLLVPRTTRVVHDMDVIPSLPPGDGYTHVGTELRIVEGGGIANPIGSWWRHFWADITGKAEKEHFIDTYIRDIALTKG